MTLVGAKKKVRAASGMDPNVIVFPSRKIAKEFLKKYPQHRLRVTNGIFWCRV